MRVLLLLLIPMVSACSKDTVANDRARERTFNRYVMRSHLTLSHCAAFGPTVWDKYNCYDSFMAGCTPEDCGQ